MGEQYKTLYKALELEQLDSNSCPYLPLSRASDLMSLSLSLFSGEMR